MCIALAAMIAREAAGEPESPVCSASVVAIVLSVAVQAREIEPTPQEIDERPPGQEAARWASALRGQRLEARIVTPLRRRFCAARSCEPTDVEIQAATERMHGVEAEFGGDRPKSDAEAREDREAARELIGTWKFHAALYAQYGGDVVWQAVGPNAVGARRRWLEDEERGGHVTFASPLLRSAFFAAVSAYGGTPISPAEAADAFAHPPWSQTTAASP